MATNPIHSLGFDKHLKHTFGIEAGVVRGSWDALVPLRLKSSGHIAKPQALSRHPRKQAHLQLAKMSLKPSHRHVLAFAKASQRPQGNHPQRCVAAMTLATSRSPENMGAHFEHASRSGKKPIGPAPRGFARKGRPYWRGPTTLKRCQCLSASMKAAVILGSRKGSFV